MKSTSDTTDRRASPVDHPKPARGARFTLREATARAHDRLDGLYSGLNLSRAEDYAAFLLAHAPAFFATEQALEEAGAAKLIPGWGNRSRAPLLVRDLEDLDLAVPASAALPRLETEAQVLGAAYVLEGSRLGAAVLVRQVGDGMPTAFLTPGNSDTWRALVALIDLKLSLETSLADATTAALSIFALFEQSARATLERMGVE